MPFRRVTERFAPPPRGVNVAALYIYSISTARVRVRVRARLRAASAPVLLQASPPTNLLLIMV